MAYTRVKSAWQNETGLYAVKTMHSDEEPKYLNKLQLEKLMDLMPGYRWIIFENPKLNGLCTQTEK
jgi:hypothetical protein